MSSITDKLEYSLETKELIKQSIIDKGVEVSDEDTLRSYANKISEIQSGGGGTDEEWISKAEYDALPDDKLTDGKNYYIYDWSESSGGNGNSVNVIVYPENSNPVIIQETTNRIYYRIYVNGNCNGNTNINIYELGQNKHYINSFGVINHPDYSYTLPSSLGSNNDWYASVFIDEASRQVKLLLGAKLKLNSNYNIYIDYYENK